MIDKNEAFKALQGDISEWIRTEAMNEEGFRLELMEVLDRVCAGSLDSMDAFDEVDIVRHRWNEE